MDNFVRPSGKPKVISTDNLLEYGNSCEDLSWIHCSSTRLRAETTGIAERAVRRMKEGTSAVLLQSGLETWWADSVECCCHLRNVDDLLAEGKTLHERRFGGPCKGPIILYGATIEHFRFLHVTRQGSTNLARKFCQEYSSVIH